MADKMQNAEPESDFYRGPQLGRSIARAWQDATFPLWAHGPDEKPEVVAECQKELKELMDELHQRGDGDKYEEQIMLSKGDEWEDGYCLHLFADGSCFGCGSGKPELWYDDVLRIVGSEEALLAINPNCADWLKAAKQRMEEFDNWRLMHARCASDVAQ